MASVDPAAARFAAARALFERALEEPPHARPGLVEAQSGGDPTLVREVLSLLAADAAATGFLERSACGGSPDDGLTTDARCGPYRLLCKLGEGGTSVVYLAARDGGPPGARVAVKLVKPGMDAADVLRRFRQEQQILASLEHPHIARLLDGGETDRGRPFFVLEYVPGEPIDDYCERRRLPRDARLELFVTVCRAVHFAHQHLVVHRDLKPSNILVSATGEPKLLDFGIAKLLDPELAAVPGDTTCAGLRPMTPSCASPEQVQGGRITTASDVYSLGVLLYRLVTGRHPYRLDTLVPGEVERVVCHIEPPAPSLAVGRRERRSRGLARDLDNVVGMAMRKRAHRRYPSALELGQDIERFVRRFPVIARRDTFRYRAATFARRHVTAVVAAGVVVVSLAVGGVGTLWQARLAIAARERAETERAQVEQVSAFLLGLFKVSGHDGSNGVRGAALELLSRGTRELARGRGQPPARAALLHTLGTAHYNLGAYREAADLLLMALALRRQALGDGHAGVADTVLQLAVTRHELGDARGAAALYEEAVRLRERSLGPDHPLVADALSGLGSLHTGGDLPLAEACFRRALDIRRRHFGPRHPLVAASVADLAVWMYARGRYGEAEELGRQALAGWRDAYDPRHLDVAGGLNSLGIILVAQGKYDEAERLLLEAYEISESELGVGHPVVVDLRSTLANVWREQGRLGQAEGAFRETLAEREKLRGARHPAVDNGLHHLATTRYLAGDYAEALELAGRAVALRRQVYGGDVHRSVAESLWLIGRVELARGEGAGAEATLRRALEIWRATVPRDHPREAEIMADLGDSLAAQGKEDDAERVLALALDTERRLLRPGHPLVAKALVSLAQLLDPRDPERAAELTREVLDMRVAALGPRHWATAQARVLLGARLARRGDPNARALVATGLADLRSALGRTHPEVKRAQQRARAVAGGER